MIILITTADEKPTGYTQLSCGHSYHPKCIADWFITAGNSTCPLCRKKACEYEIPTKHKEIPPAVAQVGAINPIPPDYLPLIPIREWLPISNEYYQNILNDYRTPDTLLHIWNTIKNQLNYINNPLKEYLQISNQEIIYILSENISGVLMSIIWTRLRYIILRQTVNQEIEGFLL